MMNTTFSFTPQLLSPREKIARYGVASLRLEEIIAVILGSGTKHMRVAALARRLSPHLFSTHPVQLADLENIHGIGRARACQIIAALELAERLQPRGYPVIQSLATALTHVADIRFSDREVLCCLYLNARQQLVAKETLAMGSANQVGVRPSDIFAAIKQQPIQYLIVVHNHPSGDPTPSTEDHEFTNKIMDACHLLDIHLLDHIIVTAHRYFSFKESVWVVDTTSPSSTPLTLPHPQPLAS